MLVKILLRLLLVTGILAVLISGFFFLENVPKDLIKYNWINLLFYFLLSLLVIIVANLGVRQKNMDSFLAGLFGALLLKMGVCIGFFLFMRYFFEIAPKLFFIPFAIFYLIFSVFETVQLFRINELAYKNEHPSKNR